MKHIWMTVLCTSLLLLGCQSEKEDVAQPKPSANINVETESEAAKATKAAEAARALAAAEVAKVAEAVKVLAAAEASKEVVTGAVTGAGPASTSVASAGDAVKGKHLAKRCKACHSFAVGGRQMTGPNLFGVYGRTAGKNTAFRKYSGDLKAADFVWDDASLAAWVCSSKEAIKTLTGNPAAKTRMPVQKKCGPKGENIAAYLKTLK